MTLAFLIAFPRTVRMPLWLVFSALGVLLPTEARATLVTVATYGFNFTLEADDPLDPALLIDPASSSGGGFLGDVDVRFVFDGPSTGRPARTVFAWEAGTGLKLDVGTWVTAGEIASDNYAVELVFRFTGPDNGFRRIINSKQPAYNDGLYVNDDRLMIYEGGNITSNTDVVTDVFRGTDFHRLVVVNQNGVLDAFINGTDVTWRVDSATVTSSVLNIEDSLRFFLDDTTEHDNGQLAYLAIHRIDGNYYDDALAFSKRTDFPAQQQAAIPEPGTLALFGFGLTPLVAFTLRKKRIQRVIA